VIPLLLGIALAGSATDSVAAGSRRLDVPGLPLVVRRFGDADLDTVATAAIPSASRTVADRDTSTSLKIAGEKTLRVGVGGEGGVAVDQTLRLDATGELAPGVEVKAHLSDQQVPLGAEGSTEALRELDEVFLQVRTRRWDLIAGDQDWSLPDGATPGATRRLRGLSTGWNDGWSARATTGSPRARWMRMVFDGVEGRQEGWILPGPEGRVRAPVVPGSERVRIDGVAMQAGTDYTLRAAEGVLDFLPRRRITGHDRIEVEWQAAVLDYQRGLTAARGASGPATAEGPRWETWALRESDDPTHPLSFSATREDDSLLREAGADASKARRPDSTAIPLPTGLDDVGFRLGWRDSSRLDVGTEVRATRWNRNLASDRDEVLDGVAGALDGTSRAGRALSQGGAGIVGTRLVLRANDAAFHPVSGRTAAGGAAARTWNDDGGEVAGASWETSGGLSWEAEPGLGVWTEAGQRRDSLALARRAEATLGLRRGDRQILSQGAFARRDEGARALDRWWTREAASWPLGPLVPRLEAQAEDLQTAWLATGIARRRWASVQAGSAARGFDGRYTGDLALQARADQSDRGGAERAPRDSSRERGFRAESKWIDEPVSADGLLDGKIVEHKAASGEWIPDRTWLGEAHVATRLHPGVETDLRWLLSLSDFLPEMQVWDTVPAGTGTHKWDSISHRIIPADDGDLVSGGTRIDTTRPAVRSARRSLSAEATVQPGLLWEGLEGVLADVGFHGRGEWEQADSSAAVQLLPDFTDDDLARSVEGRSSLEADAWWARAGHRLDLSVQRDWVVAGANAYSPATVQRDLEWRGGWGFASEAGHRAELPAKLRDRILSGQDLSRRETVRSLEPSVSLRVARIVDLRPSVLLASGSGHDGKRDMEGLLASPAFGVSLRLGTSGTARSELRWARASTAGPAGSSLSEGFLDGRTWRASAALDWNLDRHFSAGADWVLRVDPGRPAFQKASAEARAVF